MWAGKLSQTALWAGPEPAGQPGSGATPSTSTAGAGGRLKLRPPHSNLKTVGPRPGYCLQEAPMTALLQQLSTGLGDSSPQSHPLWPGWRVWSGSLLVASCPCGQPVLPVSPPQPEGCTCPSLRCCRKAGPHQREAQPDKSHLPLRVVPLQTPLPVYPASQPLGTPSRNSKPAFPAAPTPLAPVSHHLQSPLCHHALGSVSQGVQEHPPRGGPCFPPPPGTSRAEAAGNPCSWGLLPTLHVGAQRRCRMLAQSEPCVLTSPT